MNPRSHPPRPGPPTGEEHVRELEMEVAREIAESFLKGSSPLEVYRLALARVTPLVGASFASVFLRDEDDPRLLRLACAQNWPQSSARFLSDVRIREGRGPTGRSVDTGRAIEVEDVFADEALADWWEPARELGFVSMTSHPLTVGDRVFGALSFYYSERQRFDDYARALLAVVAHQLASTAERAQLLVDLRSGNLDLERENATLSRQIAAVEEALERARRREVEREEAKRDEREGEEGSAPRGEVRGDRSSKAPGSP